MFQKNRGRSRSLDEDECAFTKTVFQRGQRNFKSSQRKQILRETRKAFTLDDDTCEFTNGISGPEGLTNLSNSLKNYRKKDSQDIDEDLEDLEDELDGKLLKNLKTTIRYACTVG